MEWTQTRNDEGVVEWTREDGYATIRRRRRPDGGWVVRLDRLHQAPDGRSYRHDRVADESAAQDVIDHWKSGGRGEDGGNEADTAG